MTKRTQQKIAGRGFLRVWTSLFGGQTTIFGLGTSSSVRKKNMGWSCKGERWKAKLRWKSSVVFFCTQKKRYFSGEVDSALFLATYFYGCYFRLGGKWLPIVTGCIHIFCCCFWLKTYEKNTWVGVVFLFILSFDWVFFHWFDLDFSVSGWFLKDLFESFSPGKFGGDVIQFEEHIWSNGFTTPTHDHMYYAQMYLIRIFVFTILFFKPSPGDSKWPFYPLFGSIWRSLSHSKGHLTIPKRSKGISRQTTFHLIKTEPWIFFVKGYAAPFDGRNFPPKFLFTWKKGLRGDGRTNNHWSEKWWST